MLVIPQRFGGLVIPRVRGASVPVYAFLGYDFSMADTSTYTFTSQPFGTAAANRYICVGVNGHGSGARVVSGVTIGGVAASEAVFVAAGQTSSAGIYIAPVPTGTSGSVVVSWTAGLGRCAIGIWAIYGLASATPEDTNSNTGNAANRDVSLTGLSEHAVVLSCQSAIDNPSFSWDTLSTDYDDAWTDTSGNNQRFAGASTQFEAGGNLTITASMGVAGRSSVVSAAFR